MHDMDWNDLRDSFVDSILNESDKEIKESSADSSVHIFMEGLDKKIENFEENLNFVRNNGSIDFSEPHHSLDYLTSKKDLNSNDKSGAECVWEHRR